MRTVSVASDLFDFSLHFISFLNISLITLTFLLPDTFTFLMSWINTLRTSAEDFGTLAENDSSTGYEPNDHFTKEAYVEYTQESSGEQQFPDDFDYDDVTIGQTLMRAEDEPITLKKKACRPVCRRQSVMIERENLLLADSGRPPLSSEIRVCLQEFRENLVDERVPEHRDSHASSSHELSLDPTPKRSEDLGKHSVYTHFLKDRNCEICQKTKITRAPCRGRNGGAVPRAENFGDLRTADHKVLSGGSESRNNHQYAIVVQDLATQWIQSYPCKNKNFTRNPEKLVKVLGAKKEA